MKSVEGGSVHVLAEATRTSHAGTFFRIAVALSVWAAAGVIYASVIERRWLQMTRYDVPIVGLPDGWEGMRIIHLTDFHLGALGAPYRMMRKAMAKVVSCRPDLIVLTGDYVEDGRPRSFELLAPLAQVAPTVAILGNHDYFGRHGDPDAIVRGLEAQGITVLRNAVLPFAYGGAVGMIVGFDDNICGLGADVRGVVGRIGETKPQIALIHEPDVVESFPPHWAGVTLAGHIHGAQVRLSPFARVDWVTWTHGDKRTCYPRGWFTVNGNPLYVNRGIGVARLPIRLAARPEIALLTLVRDPAHQRDKR